jgi:hypothetical protein
MPGLSEHRCNLSRQYSVIFNHQDMHKFLKSRHGA